VTQAAMPWKSIAGEMGWILDAGYRVVLIVYSVLRIDGVGFWVFGF
jgi:hypothetical protein